MAWVDERFNFQPSIDDPMPRNINIADFDGVVIDPLRSEAGVGAGGSKKAGLADITQVAGKIARDARMSLAILG